MPPRGPAFRQACYEFIRRIPPGRVSTYGDVAWALGRPGAARAVGTAMRMNPDAPRTPCHRVVPSDGRVGFYSSAEGPAKKIRLLRSEGVRIDADNRILDFEKVRWPPRSGTA